MPRDFSQTILSNHIQGHYERIFYHNIINFCFIGKYLSLLIKPTEVNMKKYFSCPENFCPRSDSSLSDLLKYFSAFFFFLFSEFKIEYISKLYRETVSNVSSCKRNNSYFKISKLAECA